MKTISRQDLLDRLSNRTDAGGSLNGPAIDDIDIVVGGLAIAMRPIRAAISGVTRRHSLGPRGAFILRLVRGGVCYPLEIASALKAGRSLITAELDKLRDAGLITSTPGEEDKRRSRLALTPLGEEAAQEVHVSMRRIVSRNLQGYGPEEIRLFGQMLSDARRLDDTESEDGC